MTTPNKNLAMVLIAVVVVSTGGVFAFTENTQPQQTTTSLKGLPVVLGHIEIAAKDKDGNIIAYRQTDNLVVSQGLNSTINKLFQAGLQPNTCGACTAPGLFNYVGVGTGSTVLYTDTITTFATTQRSNHVLGTVTAISACCGTGMGAQIVGNWAANKLQNGSGTVAITEAALLDGVSNSTANMYAHQTFAAINVAAADTLQVTWKITFAHS